MRIRAIETRYAGTYFRSRLEARWAIWFDAMGIPWNYEIVGWSVGDARYLPDFELPSFGWHVEIKPSAIPEAEAARLSRVFYAARDSQTNLAVLQGYPAYGQYVLKVSDDPLQLAWAFADCRRCNGVSYVAHDESAWGNVGRHMCQDNEKWPDVAGARIVGAYEKAMRAKFDHLREVA